MMFKLLFISTLVGFAIGRSCISGWTRHGNSCYYFSHTVASWMEAVVMCKTHGGYLVEITSASEQRFVYQGTRKHHLGNVWIGATDDLIDNKFQWGNSGTQISYSKWLPGEPNNIHQNENCIDMYVHKGGYWNDEHCNEKRNFVCERKL